MTLIEPFSTTLDMTSGTLSPEGTIIKRHLSDMRGMYADAEAERQILAEEGDRLIYDVYLVDSLPGRD